MAIFRLASFFIDILNLAMGAFASSMPPCQAREIFFSVP
jgi:hypothetical protein